MRNVLTFLALFSLPVMAADSWLCTEESSQRRGDTFYSCGIGQAATESEARALALESAKAEFASLCDGDDSCRGRSVRLEPARTSCEGRFKCFRLVLFRIGHGLGHLAARPRGFIASLRKHFIIKTGTHKAEIVKYLGLPEQAGNLFDDGNLTFMYHGPMCDESYCYLTFDRQNRVISQSSFNLKYSDILE